jgi:putative ATP-binding cassette transporter
MRTPVMEGDNSRDRPGEHVLIEGKTPVCHKLILAVAGLWPWGAGKVTLPAGATSSLPLTGPICPWVLWAKPFATR